MKTKKGINEQARELSYFARELNAMLDNTPFSAEVIVSELNRQGFPLPLRTFNYWLQGYFLPRFDSAFTLVDALESLCGVTDKRLANALIHDLSSGVYFVPEDSRAYPFNTTLPAVMDDELKQALTVLDEKVDWSADLVRRAIRDHVYVNEDFTQFRHRVTVLAVVPDAPNPSLTISSIYEEGEHPISDNYFYDVKGAYLGKQDFYEEDGATIYGYQLYLPDTVVPGELHEISYTWDYVTPKPVPKLGERIFPWMLEFYSCTLTFEGGMPEHIEYVTYSSSEEKDNPVVSDIPMIREGNTVRIATKDFGHVTAYFRYSTSGIEGE